MPTSLLSMLRRPVMPGWLTVLVRPDAVTSLYVERSGDRTTLKWLRQMPFDGDPVRTIAGVRRSLAGKRYRCSTMLPRDSYQTFEVAAPKVDRSEWRDALRWVIKDNLEFPVDQALIEAIPIPNDGAPPGRQPMTFVIAAKREIVARHMHLFQRGRLPLDVISIGNMAQRNVATLFESKGRGLAFLGIYQQGAVLTFTCDGAMYAARHISWNLAALRDDAEPEVRRLQFERVVLDLQRALDSFDSQFGHVVLQRLVLAVRPGHTRLVALLKESLGQTVELADLREVMDMSACPDLREPAAQAHWMLPIGMALHQGGDA